MCLKVASLTKPVAKIDTADTDTEDNDEVTKNECAAGTFDRADTTYILHAGVRTP